MKKITITLTVLISIFITSCAFFKTINPPSRIIENMKCFESISFVNIENSVNCNGYYLITGKYDTDNSFGCLNIDNDSVKTPIIFFEDGTIAWGFSLTQDGINEYFQRTINELEKGEIPSFYNWFYWGHYEVRNDSIIAQIINHPSAQQSWKPFLIYLKIHSSEKISLLGAKILDPKYERLIISENFYIGNFFITDTVPPPLPWVKSKKWFWCDQIEYEQYKRKLNK